MEKFNLTTPEDHQAGKHTVKMVDIGGHSCVTWIAHEDAQIKIKNDDILRALPSRATAEVMLEDAIVRARGGRKLK